MIMHTYKKPCELIKCVARWLSDAVAFNLSDDPESFEKC